MLSHVTTNSALITWSRQLTHVPDGFVVNVTRGLNTRSRFLPNGKLASYTLRELTPGQHYHVTLTSVKTVGQEQIHSAPQRLAFATCKREGNCQDVPISSCRLLTLLLCFSSDAVPMEGRSGRRERPTGAGAQGRRTVPLSQPQVTGGSAQTENSEELPRYTLALERRLFVSVL